MTDEAAALLQKLRDANDGITLTREELLVLRRMLPQPCERDDSFPATRDRLIAALFWLYKANGMRTKAAVNKVHQFYGLSRSTILQARRKRPLRDLKDVFSAEERAELITFYETRAPPR